MRDPDLGLLEQAARAGGRIALRHWKRSPRVWEKDDGAGPVSEADLEVNRALEALLRGARPDYGWLSEESPDGTARLSAARVFVLDPIDGTRAFLAGEENFAISLAVVQGGVPVAGVVFLPARDRLYAADAGGPATCNGQTIRASDRADETGASLLATGATMAPEHWPGGVPDLQRSFRTSLAYRLSLVAEGRHDGMATFRDAWEWDIAAGALIAAQAGARVTDRNGDPLTFNAADPRCPGVICAAPGLHAALMNRRQRA